MAHVHQHPVYMLGNLVYVNGQPYGADSGHINTVVVNGALYVMLSEVLDLYGNVEEVTKLRVRPPGIRTELVNIHQTPPKRVLIPLTMVPRAMAMIRSRLNRDDDEQMEDTTSSEEEANSDDLADIASDSESLEVESASEEEEEAIEETTTTTSSSSEESEEESDDDVRPGKRRHTSSTSKRPLKSRRTTKH